MFVNKFIINVEDNIVKKVLKCLKVKLNIWDKFGIDLE